MFYFLQGRMAKQKIITVNSFLLDCGQEIALGAVF